MTVNLSVLMVCMRTVHKPFCTQFTAKVAFHFKTTAFTRYTPVIIGKIFKYVAKLVYVWRNSK